LNEKDHTPIAIAEINKSVKPRTSFPVLEATSIEYAIAVNTPNHSSDFSLNIGHPYETIFKITE
jgi:hypothetical protein